jgi:hypothetical protein
MNLVLLCSKMHNVFEILSHLFLYSWNRVDSTNDDKNDDVYLMLTSTVCEANTDRQLMTSPITSNDMFSKNSSAKSFMALNAVTKEAFGHSVVGGFGVPGEVPPLLGALSHRPGESPVVLGDNSNFIAATVLKEAGMERSKSSIAFHPPSYSPI